MNIGVANSIYQDDEYNPIRTIEYAHQHGFNEVQIYLNEQIKENIDLQIKIASLAVRFRIGLIVHLPAGVERYEQDTDIIPAVHRLLSGQDRKFAVVHIENTDLDFWTDLILMFNDSGITPLLENFYQNKTSDELLNQLNLLRALKANLTLRYNFLFDIPRLYNCNSVEDVPDIDSILQKYFECFRDDLPAYFHLIDAVNYMQRREDWCAVGNGNIPYSKISKYVLSLLEATIIFEYENREFLLESKIAVEGWE